MTIKKSGQQFADRIWFIPGNVWDYPRAPLPRMRLYIANTITEPTMATNRLQILKPVIPEPPIALKTNPPTSPPITPAMIFARIPIPASFLVILLAIHPAIAPITIHPNQPRSHTSLRFVDLLLYFLYFLYFMYFNENEGKCKLIHTFSHKNVSFITLFNSIQKPTVFDNFNLIF